MLIYYKIKSIPIRVQAELNSFIFLVFLSVLLQEFNNVMVLLQKIESLKSPGKALSDSFKRMACKPVNLYQKNEIISDVQPEVLAHLTRHFVYTNKY